MTGADALFPGRARDRCLPAASLSARASRRVWDVGIARWKRTRDERLHWRSDARCQIGKRSPPRTFTPSRLPEKRKGARRSAPTVGEPPKLLPFLSNNVSLHFRLISVLSPSIGGADSLRARSGSGIYVITQHSAFGFASLLSGVARRPLHESAAFYRDEEKGLATRNASMTIITSSVGLPAIPFLFFSFVGLPLLPQPKKRRCRWNSRSMVVLLPAAPPLSDATATFALFSEKAPDVRWLLWCRRFSDVIPASGDVERCWLKRRKIKVREGRFGYNSRVWFPGSFSRRNKPAIRFKRSGRCATGTEELVFVYNVAL